MKTLLTKVLIALGCVLVILISLGLVLPKDINVTKSVIINDSPESVHAWIEDLSRWPLWFPWDAYERGVAVVPGDITKGVGASQFWVADSAYAEFDVTSSSLSDGISLDVYLDSSHRYRCRSAIRYRQIGRYKTEVTWHLYGKMDNPLVGAFYAAAFDSVVNDMFGRGLDNLKDIIENPK